MDDACRGLLAQKADIRHDEEIFAPIPGGFVINVKFLLILTPCRFAAQ